MAQSAWGARHSASTDSSCADGATSAAVVHESNQSISPLTARTASMDSSDHPPDGCVSQRPMVWALASNEFMTSPIRFESRLTLMRARSQQQWGELERSVIDWLPLCPGLCDHPRLRSHVRRRSKVPWPIASTFSTALTARCDPNDSASLHQLALHLSSRFCAITVLYVREGQRKCIIGGGRV